MFGPGRARGGYPIVGSAVTRRPGDGLLFGPWGRWFPLYSSGFGWNLGYVSYDPWVYGTTRWVWGRYGLWYDPYSPYGYYDPFYGQGYGGGYFSEPERRETTGSIRLRADPSNAQVYVDGTLMGTVDDFDGFSNHLAVSGGRHQLELRADGYKTYTTDINVEVGKTITARASLKKK